MATTGWFNGFPRIDPWSTASPKASAEAGAPTVPDRTSRGDEALNREEATAIANPKTATLREILRTPEPSARIGHRLTQTPAKSAGNERLGAVRVTAKVDYALRALVELAAAGGATVKGDRLAEAQGIPLKFLENILAELRRAGIVGSQRGAEGGYRLVRDADTVSVADVVRAVEGPLADVHGTPPESLEPPGVAAPVREVWVATRAALRSVLEVVSVGEIARGELPGAVTSRLDDPSAWTRR
jgi:Rrf2 family protein